MIKIILLFGDWQRLTNVINVDNNLVVRYITLYLNYCWVIVTLQDVSKGGNERFPVALIVNLCLPYTPISPPCPLIVYQICHCDSCCFLETSPSVYLRHWSWKPEVEICFIYFCPKQYTYYFSKYFLTFM